ncbi:MAG TPA: hypothetical protein VIL86_00465 [Tepidisphaeraceae bacterium]|jgi:uncharacterized DUF497 family protein
MSYDFRWIAWNISKVENHGLTMSDVEYVVNNARRPYPKPMGNEKWLVIGSIRRGLVIQVIYLVDSKDTLFVIHARPLTRNERRRRWRTK